jgi:hypothetical protein
VFPSWSPSSDGSAEAAFEVDGVGLGLAARAGIAMSPITTMSATVSRTRLGVTRGRILGE